MRYITEAIKLMDAQQTRTALEHKSKGIRLEADHLTPFYENRQKIFFSPDFSVTALRNNLVSTQRHKTDLLSKDSRQQ